MSDGVILLGMSKGKGARAQSPTMRCWAEGGRVCHEDLDGSNFGSKDCVEAWLHVMAVTEMLGTPDEPGIEHTTGNSRRVLEKFVADMHAVIKEAYEQGEFGNPDTTTMLEAARPKTYNMHHNTPVRFAPTYLSGNPEGVGTLYGAAPKESAPFTKGPVGVGAQLKRAAQKRQY